MQDIASPIFNLFNAHQDAHLRFVTDPEPAPAEDHVPPNESSNRKELLNQLGDRLEQLQRLVAHPYTGPSSLDEWPAIDDYHRLTEAILSLAGSLGVKKIDPKHIDGIIHRIDQRYPKLGLLLFVEGLIKKIESVPISPKKRIEQRLVAGVDLQGKKQLSTIYNLMISPEWKVTLPSGSWKELAPLLRELSNGQIQGARNSAKPVTMQDIDFKQADKMFDDAFGLAAFFELQRQHLIWSLRWNDKVFAAATWVSLTYNPDWDARVRHVVVNPNGTPDEWRLEEKKDQERTKLDKPATAQEAIQAAQLDWPVIKLPLSAGSKHIPVPDKFAVVRKTSNLVQKTDLVLGVVGKDYTPLQNRDAFRFFDPIVGQNAAIYHTAGALGQGERVWILAKLPGHIRVAGDDITEKYLLLSNSHDGKSSVQIKFTPVRVVCQNTLTIALADGQAYRVIHHADIHSKLEQAHTMLGLINEQFDDMEETFQAMSRVKMDTNRLSEYLATVYPTVKEPDKMELVQRDRNWSEYFFDQGRGNRLPGVNGSLWAAFNGVTEWLDHRKSRQNPNQRLVSTWFGGSSQIKARAFSAAQDLMAVWN